jgi:SNF2 family DNA or RNA helicase
VSPKQQNLNVDRFLEDPTCRVLIAQPLSAGMGLNLQGVSSDVLFLETPLVPKDFHQAVGRVYREGQTKTPNVRIAIAAGTIQERLHRQLLLKDELVNKVQIGFQNLREAIYGR